MSDPVEEISRLRAELERLALQMAKLEERVHALEKGGVSPVLPPTPTPAAPDKARLESHFGLAVVNRIGALTLAIGIIFFFKYAVDNQWLGATGRILLGVLAGLVLIAAAEWLRARAQRVFSQGIAGCGLATLYISLYAAFAYYELISSSIAFSLLVGVCILAIALSIRYRNPAIAALGFLGGLLTPIILSSRATDADVGFVYLLLVDFTCVLVAVRESWAVLVPCIGTLTILDGLIVFESRHAVTLLLLAFVLAVVHFVFALRSKSVQAMFRVLYLTGHGCLILASLQALRLWVSFSVEPGNRGSAMNEAYSFLLGVYGLVMLIYGIARRSTIDRVLGLFLLGLVTAKLYLWDVWFLVRLYRMTAFVALGILLLAASYIYSRWRSGTSADS